MVTKLNELISVYAFRDLMTWTFDLLTLVSGHTRRVTGSTPPPSLKISLSVLELSVLSSDTSHRIPLTTRLQPLRMRRITWPMRWGKFFPHIWNPWLQFQFAYSLYNFCVDTLTFKVCLLLASPMFKAVFRPQISMYRRNRAPKWPFWGKGGVNVNFWFCDS